MDKQTNSWEEEFDRKINDLRNSSDIYPVSDEMDFPVQEFGYKYQRGNEIFSATDWGNVKKFISKTISQEKEKWVAEKVNEIKELKDAFQKDGLVTSEFVTNYIINLLQNK